MVQATLFTVLMLAFNSAFADGRELIRDPADPEGTVGRLTTPRNRKCTATTVAKKILLTTARCVLDSKTNQIIKGDYEFRTVYRGRVETAGVKKFWVGTTDYKDTANNWALLETDREIGVQVGRLGTESIEVDKFNTLDSRTLHVITYPHDLGSGTQAYLEKGCMFTGTALGGQLVTHNCVMSGTTGSPIFIYVPEFNTYRIVALTTAHGSDHTVAIPTITFMEKFLEVRKLLQ